MHCVMSPRSSGKKPEACAWQVSEGPGKIKTVPLLLSIIQTFCSKTKKVHTWSGAEITPEVQGSQSLKFEYMIKPEKTAHTPIIQRPSKFKYKALEEGQRLVGKLSATL